LGRRHDIFAQIPDFKGPTVGVGLSGILMLVLLQKMGDRWGKKSKIIWAIGALPLSKTPAIFPEC